MDFEENAAPTEKIRAETVTVTVIIMVANHISIFEQFDILVTNLIKRHTKEISETSFLSFFRSLVLF